MRLTLCLPGLLLPRQAFRDCAHDLPLPALNHLLGIGRINRGTSRSIDTWIARRFGYETLPAAALRFAGEGGDSGGAAWLNLDPVHLSVARNGVSLSDPKQLDLTAEEDAALRTALSPLFAELGTLRSGQPGHWSMEINAAADIETLPLPDAIGVPVSPDWPGGKDGPRWRRALAEAQMLLHTHPVNAQREARGQSTINSLWPWGEGALKTTTSAPYDTIWARDAILNGLARTSGIKSSEPPAVFAEGKGRVLARCDDLVGPAHALDGIAWRNALARLERDWFAPLAAARVELRLAAFGTDTGIELDVSRADRWKFWRRPVALENLYPSELP